LTWTIYLLYLGHHTGDNDMRTNDYDMQSPFEIDAETFAEMLAQLQANSEEVEDADYADCPW